MDEKKKNRRYNIGVAVFLIALFVIGIAVQVYTGEGGMPVIGIILELLFTIIYIAKYKIDVFSVIMILLNIGMFIGLIAEIPILYFSTAGILALIIAFAFFGGAQDR